MPILVGLVATVLLHIPVLADRRLWAGVACFCGCSGGLVGFLPAFLAARRDAGVRAAQGFTVSFIAVGLGAFLVACGSMLFSEISAGLRTEVSDVMDQAMADAGRELTPEERTEMLDTVMTFMKYSPVTGAILLSVCGGIVGALTAYFVNRGGPSKGNEEVFEAPNDRWNSTPPTAD